MQEIFKQNKRKKALLCGQRAKKEKDPDSFFQRVFCFVVVSLLLILKQDSLDTLHLNNITERQFKSANSVTWGLSSSKKIFLKWEMITVLNKCVVPFKYCHLFF